MHRDLGKPDPETIILLLLVLEICPLILDLQVFDVWVKI